MTTIRQLIQDRWFVVYIAIFVLAFLLRWAIHDYGLPFIHNIDEPNMYLLANDWRNELDAGWRNDWLAGYPPGYIWLTIGIFEVIDASLQPNIHTDMALYIRILRLISLGADLITLAVLMRTAYILVGHTGAIFLGGIWSVSAEIVFNGITALPDIFSYLFIAFCVLSSVYAHQHESWRWAIVATTFALLAIVFKYAIFPILFLPAFIF